MKREILHDVDDPELAYFVEEILVDEKFIKRDDTYNIYPGGAGGDRYFTDKTKQKLSKSKKGNTYWLGKKHTQKTKDKISKANSGKKRSPEIKLQMSKTIQQVLREGRISGS